MFDDEEMEEIRNIFLEESYEGLDVMESGLLSLSPGETDLEIINDIFRAAHSIKGGAGMFGFDEVAVFTHGVETLLDQMRDGGRIVTSAVVDLLLKSVDCLREMLDAIRDHAEIRSESQDEVTSRIKEMLEEQDAQGQESVDVAKAEVATEVPEPEQTGTTGWQISYKPYPEILKTGNDPIHIFRELRTFGLLEVTPQISELPDLEDMDPVLCYLSWDLKLTGDVEYEKVKSAFDWVEDESDLEIKAVVSAQKDSEKGSEASSVQKSPSLRVVPGVKDRRVSHDRREGDRRSSSSPSPRESGSIRVDIDKIDALLNLVGELVITQSSLSRFRKEFSESETEELTDRLVQLERNTRELQESAMQIRMLPIKVTFSRFPRMVHDLSSQMGKKIQLNLSGEQTELDKTVLEKIGDPLVHLVRNSVDHGIETVEERIKAGKPETGVINLSAYHEAGNIVIEISDDGKGLNKERIIAKARQKGLLNEETVVTDEYIHNLIFLPGFSTAETVTGVSGRGVGMDVVLRNIQDLGGRIEVQSEEGVGSTFTIRLPLTLAILDGQLVRIGNDVYVIPLLSIAETLLIDQNKFNMIAGKKRLYQFRDENIPVIRTHNVWDFSREDIDGQDDDFEDKLLMVLKSGNHLIGLVVDELLDQQQVVIKSLETNYREIGGLSGATILGDGSVVLIVDAPGLVQLCLNREKSWSEAGDAHEVN